MISTITPATIAAVSSVTASVGLANSLSLTAVFAFMALLILKELVSVGVGQWSMALSRGLNIGIVPLGLASLMIAVTQLARVLS